MLIEKIHIEKFRGFKNVEFELGQNITVIAGQNGTQKTTILGMLSQPFSITDKSNPLLSEKPLSGGNYKSSFSEKFKLSKNFDAPKTHSWTLFTNDNDNPEFTLESITRNQNTQDIRFWKKGDRSRGSGYLQYPVIYLSLSRLFPIGEDRTLKANDTIILTRDEIRLLNDWHNKILIIPDLEIKELNYLESTQKNTIGVNTDFYDWQMNSAGQDNLGKILLAVLSFKRLKENYPNEYTKGILVIDEIDTTLYPASQIKLFEHLRRFSSKYNIQIIFTTHSLNLLELATSIQQDPKQSKQIKVIYLQKIDNEIKAIDNLTFGSIQNKLNVSLSTSKQKTKINTFTEDKEGEIFLKGLLKSKKSTLNFIQCTMGCANYLELVKRNIPGFSFPQSLICLDGDVKNEKKNMRLITGFKNIILLPGNNSPERLLAEMLNSELESSEIWEQLFPEYTKQICFSEYTIKDIETDRQKAKLWFNSQKQYWGTNCTKVINFWINKNKPLHTEFLEQFEIVLEKFKN
ncbi:ABC oligo/dipeptide transport, ATP-binding protein [Elizabethkingia anophelis]|uniref:AAA family ATPase n=1 Tax=Elizabethkingia anophelis TaxID=1117645 RepID=UPI000998FFE3|nr:AAA family ATPase [Elizabethkingia anophelis]OPC19545.1 ABC oligo/dipeptide transport, ATP-binding protein [Elizabethkingia anophelis]